MSTTNSDARINFRLSSELKTIEDAAAELGQSISDFAISTLVQAARKVLHDQQVTRLGERDRQVFAALLDDPRHLFLTMAEVRKLKLDPY